MLYLLPVFAALQNGSIETPHRPHRPTVWSFIQDHYSLILIFTSASATSEHGVVCEEVQQLLSHKGNALTMDPARALMRSLRLLVVASSILAFAAS